MEAGMNIYMKTEQEPTIDDIMTSLPKSIPIIDMSGTILMPRFNLPVTLFSEDHISVVNGCIKKDRCLGFIQPNTNDSDDKYLRFFDVGCFGRISTFSEKDDGSVFIVISGIIRFHLNKIKQSNGSYYKANVSYDAFIEDLFEAEDTLTPEDRQSLLILLDRYFKANDMDVEWDDILSSSDDSLLSMITMIYPFDAVEKQTILECKNNIERAKTISSFMGMIAMQYDEFDRMQ